MTEEELNKSIGLILPEHGCLVGVNGGPSTLSLLKPAAIRCFIEKREDTHAQNIRKAFDILDRYNFLKFGDWTML